MPDHLTPGVLVDESPSPPPEIRGVATGTAALVGETERGALRPRLVTSVAEYERWYGAGCGSDRYLPAAADGFFENGGARLYVARVVGDGASTASAVFGPFVVEADGPGAWGSRVWARVVGEPGGASFALQLASWAERPAVAFDPFEQPAQQPRPRLQEEYIGLSTDPASPDHFTARLIDANGRSVSPLATVRLAVAGVPPDLATLPPGGFLDGGADAPAPPSVTDFRGDPSAVRPEPQGLRALEAPEYDEVALVGAPFPPEDSAAIARAVVEHCERQRFRFAVIDSDPTIDLARLDPRDAATGAGDSRQAAFYAPWIVVADSSTGMRRELPPAGHVLGVYARTDRERGVFKAPAGQSLRGAIDVAAGITDTLQDVLNPLGVNAIRRFPGRGILVWGARTLSTDSDWKYVSVRRLFIFLERSIEEGTRWAVFEQNAEPLWVRIRAAVEQFLLAQWRTGALAGRTADEAFFVRCDRTTMTQHDIDNGRLVCLIGVAPLKPAEFVIFRIGQKTIGARR